MAMIGQVALVIASAVFHACRGPSYGLIIDGHEVHVANGTLARAVLADLRMHRTGKLTFPQYICLCVAAGFRRPFALVMVVHVALLVLLEEEHDLADLLVALGFVFALAGFD
jgi:hypothetical protein